MNFLNPGFLFALSALAIPVIIHLFNFRKYRRVFFSNVQFLQEVNQQQTSRSKLKNRLILFSRLFAIAMIVLAFSRPYLTGNGAVSPGSAQFVSIYIDNSYSMQTENKEGGLLETAKRNALSIAKTFNENARFQLITNDFEGKHQKPMSFADFKLAVEDVKISSASRTLQQVIARHKNEVGIQFFYVLSDFQKNFAGTKPISVDSNIRLSLIKLNASNVSNVAADSVWFISPAHQPGAAEQLVVRVRNFGDETAEKIPLRLTVNGEQKAIGTLTLPAGKAVTDTLRFSGLTEGWKRGVVSIKDYPLTFDDAFNFSFQVNSGIRVLCINGKQEKNYLTALFATDPYFKLTEMAASNIDYSAFSSFQLIVLNETQISSGLAQQVRSYAEGGGSVVIFPDLSAGQESRNLFPQMGLPAVAGISVAETKVSSLDLRHSLFKEMFTAVPKNWDLPVVHQSITFAGVGRGNSLISMPANRTFLSEFPQRKGSIYLFSVGLNDRDSNFPEHPLFVPVMLKLAFLSVTELPLSYIAGKDNVLETGINPTGQSQTVTLQASNFEIIPELRSFGGKTQLFISDQIKKAGFYDLLNAGSVDGVYAFNTVGSESEMKFNSLSEIKALFGKHPVSFINSRHDALPSGTVLQSNGTELWKLFLVLAALFLAIEVILIKFFNRST